MMTAEQRTDHLAGVRQLFQFAQQRSHQHPNACFVRQPYQPLVPTGCMQFFQDFAEQVRISNPGYLHQVSGLLK